MFDLDSEAINGLKDKARSFSKFKKQEALQDMIEHYLLLRFCDFSDAEIKAKITNAFDFFNKFQNGKIKENDNLGFF